MGNITSETKAAQTATHTSITSTSAGPTGVSLAPPAYGIGLLDNAPSEAMNKQGSKHQAQESVTWNAPFSIQTKLEVSQPDDPYEQEAVAVASHVTSGNTFVPSISAIAPGTMPQTMNKEKNKYDQNPMQKVEEKKSEQKLAGKAGAIERGEAVSPGNGTGITDKAIAHRGSGRPMNPDTRHILESRMGADLGNVRIHDDTNAHEATQSLNASAFTHGHNIWLGSGQSDSDVALMAHEATHVVQQSTGAGIQRQMIQRKPLTAPIINGSTADVTQPASPTTLPIVVQRAKPVSPPDPNAGKITKSDEITFPEIEIPYSKSIKHRKKLYDKRKDSPGLIRKKNYDRGKPKQRNKWKEDVGEKSATNVKDKLEKKVKNTNKVTTVNQNDQHVFRYGKASDNTPRYYIGNFDAVVKELSVPYWNHNGKFQRYDVDHIVELQLANWGGNDKWANEIENMELLDSSINTQSGSIIKTNIREKAKKFLEANPGQKSVDRILGKYNLVFEKVKGIGGDLAKDEDYWKQEDIEKGEQIDYVNVANPAELHKVGKIKVFQGETGGVAKTFQWAEPSMKPVPAEQNERDFLKPFEIKTKSFDISSTGKKMGEFIVNIPQNHKKWKQLKKDEDVSVMRIPETNAGYLDKRIEVLRLASKLEHKKTSPVVINEVDIGPEGLVVNGEILPEVPIIKNIGLKFELRGDDLTIFKEFSPGEFKVPRPLVIRDSTLKILASAQRGFGIEGQLDFGIERVGEGQLRAGATTEDGIDLEGSFNFDTKLFNPAAITMRYRKDATGNYAFSAEGEIGIKEGKVRGIKSANIKASYKEGKLEANGNAQLTVPGIKEGSMKLSYSEQEGFAIGGSFQLADNIPGIKSGSVEAQVKQKKGEEGYEVTAKGTAIPKIPGVDATLTVSYENGAITVEGQAAYQKGMLKGTLLLGATNRPIGADGKPAGEPSQNLTAYGGGTLTIQIAPWLQGTIGVRLLPNGEIEVSGEIGLPKSLDIFPEKKLDRNIFKIGLDIPIIGVAAGGQRVGIFATVGGGMDLSAGIGPAQLQELKLGITYNPSHEDQTKVTGNANLHIPAHAGLRLFVRGGIGAGIPLVSAQAYLEIGGQLGLEGALNASVAVAWTPTKGLKLDALGSIYVEPKLKFDISGNVLVEFGVLNITTELYKKTYKLAAFEYGSNLRFGLKFPIHYDEGKPFDISLKDIEFEVPKIDPKQILPDIIKHVV